MKDFFKENWGLLLGILYLLFTGIFLTVILGNGYIEQLWLKVITIFGIHLSFMGSGIILSFIMFWEE